MKELFDTFSLTIKIYTLDTFTKPGKNVGREFIYEIYRFDSMVFKSNPHFIPFAKNGRGYETQGKEYKAMIKEAKTNLIKSIY